MVSAELGSGLPIAAESLLLNWEDTECVLVAGELWLDPDVDIRCGKLPSLFMSGAIYIELFICCWYDIAVGNDSLKSRFTSLYRAIVAIAACVVMYAFTRWFISGEFVCKWAVRYL